MDKIHNIKSLLKIANKLHQSGFVEDASILKKIVSAVIEKITLQDALLFFAKRVTRNKQNVQVTGKQIHDLYKQNSPEMLQKLVTVAGNSILDSSSNQVLIDFIPENMQEINESSNWNVNLYLTPVLPQFISHIEQFVGDNISKYVLLLLNNDTPSVYKEIREYIQSLLIKVNIEDTVIINALTSAVGNSLYDIVNAGENKKIIDNLYEQLDTTDLKNSKDLIPNINLALNQIYQNTVSMLNDAIASRVTLIAQKYDEQVKQLDKMITKDSVSEG